MALRVYPAAGGLVKIPAAWLIEQAGFPKGYALGAAGISSRHTLALINRGGGEGGGDSCAGADRSSPRFRSDLVFGLEMEPVMLGF